MAARSTSNTVINIRNLYFADNTVVIRCVESASLFSVEIRNRSIVKMA